MSSYTASESAVAVFILEDAVDAGVDLALRFGHWSRLQRRMLAMAVGGARRPAPAIWHQTGFTAEADAVVATCQILQPGTGCRRADKETGSAVQKPDADPDTDIHRQYRQLCSDAWRHHIHAMEQAGACTDEQVVRGSRGSSSRTSSSSPNWRRGRREGPMIPASEKAAYFFVRVRSSPNASTERFGSSAGVGAHAQPAAIA